MTGSTLALLSSAGGRTRRATRQTAARRNRHICEAAETVLSACARPGSDIEALAQALIAAGKPARPLPPFSPSPLPHQGQATGKELRPFPVTSLPVA